MHPREADSDKRMMSIHRGVVIKERRNSPRKRNSPVTLKHVDPLAFREAMILAGWDATRIRIIDTTTVLVVNNSIVMSRRDSARGM